MISLTSAAADNNAHWCQAMCSAHGLAGRFDAKAWTVPVRSPLYYPDAVTLSADAVAADLLPRIDDSPGCSIKDSFGELDLSNEGFDILFEAQWIYRRPQPSRSAVDGPAWRQVTTAAELERWAAAFGDVDSTDTPFVPELLADTEVAIIAGYDGGELGGGAVLNRRGDGIGVSNLFDRHGDVDAAWAGALRLIADDFDGLPVYGYESGEDLAAPLRAGFTTAGTLRVWLR